MLVVEIVDPRLEFLDTNQQYDRPRAVLTVILAKVDVRIRLFGIIRVGSKRELARMKGTDLTRPEPPANANNDRVPCAQASVLGLNGYWSNRWFEDISVWTRGVM